MSLNACAAHPEYAGAVDSELSPAVSVLQLFETAWDNLAAIADKNQMTRTEVIEIFARNGK